MATARLTSKGQLTVPRAVREKLKLRTGDVVDFQVAADGTARMAPVSRKVSEVYGLLARKGRKPLDVDEMDAQVARTLKRKRR